MSTLHLQSLALLVPKFVQRTHARLRHVARLPRICLGSRLALAIILSFGSMGTGAGILNSICLAGDWPQILGPSRSGQAVDEQPLATDWKANTPKILWRLPAESGYAGAAIVGSKVFAFDRLADKERLSALDLQSGKALWQSTWPATYRSGINPDIGPRAVPTVVGNQVVCYGADGQLVCLETQTGKIQWQRSLRKEFKADEGYFGAGTSPVIIGNVVIVNVGGKQAGVVGVSLSDGRDVWKATSFDASYSSPIAVDAGGVPAALVVTRLQTVLIQADNGTVLGQTDFGSRGPTVNAATPIAIGPNRFLLTASYGIGTKTLSITGGKLVADKKEPELLASQYNTPVLVNNLICGAHGREDMGGVTLRTIDAQTLKLLNEQPLPGTTHVIAVGNQLLLASNDGTLQLASLASGKPQIEASFQLTDASSAGNVFRAVPAFSEGIFIARSSKEDGSGGQWIAVTLPRG